MFNPNHQNYNCAKSRGYTIYYGVLNRAWATRSFPRPLSLCSMIPIIALSVSAIGFSWGRTAMWPGTALSTIPRRAAKMAFHVAGWNLA